MLRIDVASADGQLPSSRSQILSVITAEKERIAVLEDELKGRDGKLVAWMVAAGIGWAAAAILFALWMLGVTPG
jgi:GTP-sensing pleiotropic transcriptional regulator CodY